METADPKFGGPVEMSRTLGIFLHENGHKHDLVTLDPPGMQPAASYPGNLYAMGPSRDRSIKGLYRYSPQIKTWLAENAPKYDAVIISGLWRYQTRAAARVLAKGNVPYVVFTHGMLDPWFRRRYPLKHAIKQVSWWFSEGPTLRNARYVVFTCEEEGFWRTTLFGLTRSMACRLVMAQPM
jgi:glycosyltransferase involved in cell wall biosynthesis